jgi:hypothetical protein
MIGYKYGPEPRVSPPLETKVLHIEVENLGDSSFSEVIRASLRVQCAPFVQATAAVTGIGDIFAQVLFSLETQSIDPSNLSKNLEDIQDPFSMMVIMNQYRPNVSFF